jgi:chorismate mutase/prephenate dehydratase
MKLVLKGNFHVGYQGVPGAYSYLAMNQYFKGCSITSEAFSSFDDVVEAVKNGTVQYGVLPIENSSTGGITNVYDLIRHNNINIVGEKIVKVEHCLLVCPGTQLEEIKKVYSHPQGLAQCHEFFKDHPEMQECPYTNTAKAAQLVSEKKDHALAAIAGAQAAEPYGLEVLMRGIQSNKSNYTRFVIISRQAEIPPEANKITLVVSLPHKPGSLYHVLGHFEQNGINMTNIESRPIEGRPWEYFFHMDITGHLNDQAVQNALAGLSLEDAHYKLLGNYVADEPDKD